MKLDVRSFHYIKDGGSSNDFVALGDKVFAVFDGVSLFDNGKLDISLPKKAAREAADTVISLSYGISDIRALRGVFKEINQRINRLNASLGIHFKNVDCVDRQLLSVVGSFGFFRDGILYFGQINDSGVMVLDQLGNREIDFVLNQTPFLKYISKIRKEKNFEAGSADDHIFIRTHVVNNYDLEFDGKKLMFGVINGDPKCERFFHFGSTDLSFGQVALFYTDGFIPFVYDQEFMKLLFVGDYELLDKFVRKKEESSEKYQKEKSLIIVRVNP